MLYISRIHRAVISHQNYLSSRCIILIQRMAIRSPLSLLKVGISFWGYDVTSYLVPCSFQGVFGARRSGAGGCLVSGGCLMPGGSGARGWRHYPPQTTKVGVTHPTGMHSCCEDILTTRQVKMGSRYGRKPYSQVAFKSSYWLHSVVDPAPRYGSKKHEIYAATFGGNLFYRPQTKFGAR